MSHLNLLVLLIIIALAASQISLSSTAGSSVKVCRGPYECIEGSLCHKPEGAKSSDYGRCQPILGVKSTVKGVEPKLVPPINMDEYLASRDANLKNKMHPEAHGTCGNEHMHYEKIANPETSAQTPCGSSQKCDFPATRDSYSNFTTTPYQVLKVYWLVFKCNLWADKAEKEISYATYDMNLKYASIGFQFNAYLNLYPCTGTDGTADYNTFPSDGNKVVNAVLAEKGTSYQKTQGGFQIVAGTPTDSTLNGFMFLPTGSYAGIGFMNTGVVSSGFTTLSHEVGHAFGLLHTFAGVSETTACACAESTASDLTGDFCSDTPPIARNWDCVSPISTTNAPDPCTSRGTQWDPNPYKNLMSYGTCRDVFTAQQTRRVRCYREKNLGWVELDTNPLRNYTQGPVPTDPPPGAASSYILSFMAIIATFFALV